MSDIQEEIKVNIPTGEKGLWRVERFIVTEDHAAFSSSYRGRFTPAGEYTRLMRGKTVVMSDTPNEIDDIREPIRRASGNVLVNGLGLGVLVNAILTKPTVSRVTVIEISEDVIQLVGAHYQKQYGERLHIVNADALKYKPTNGDYYSVAWHDIWDNICADNLPQMKTLHRKYGRICDWQDSWCREYIRCV